MRRRRGKNKGAKDEDSDVNADEDNIPADSRKVIQRMKEIVNLSEQEIYATLVECNMKPSFAINRLLHQVPFHEVLETECRETEDTSDSCSHGVDNSIEDSESNGSDENKLSSDETSDAQGTSNQLADSCTSSSILGPYPLNSDQANGETKIVPVSSAEAAPSVSVPSSSDLTNVETKIVPVSSAEAAPSLSVPSSSDHLPKVGTKRVPISSGKAVPRRPSRMIPPWDGGKSGQRTMADVLKTSLGLWKESVTEAPVKDGCPLHEKPDATNPASDSFVESDAGRDQLRESASVSNQNLRDVGCSYFSNPFFESSAWRDQLQDSALVYQNLRDEDVTYPSNSYAAGRDQLGGSASTSNQNLLNEDYGGSRMLCDEGNNENDEHNQTKDPSASNVTTGLQQLSVENDEPEALVEEDETRGLPPSLSFKHYLTGDDEDEGQWRDIVNEQMAYENAYQIYHETDQQYETHEPAMHQGANTRESDPQHSAIPFNQSMPTASSHGRRPSTSMNEGLRTGRRFVPHRNQQAMNHHNSHPHQVPLAQYGNTMNSTYLSPEQNNMRPPSAFQQHGGSNNNNSYPHQSLASIAPPEYRNSHLPQSAAAIDPSAYSFAYGSAFAAGTSSYNAANSRLRYEDILSSRFHGSDRLPSIQHQNVNSNIWRMREEDTWRLVRPHRNQQTQSFRQSQQQQQGQEHQNNACDPSGQTRWRRHNY